jgi:antitoxin YefM
MQHHWATDGPRSGTRAEYHALADELYGQVAASGELRRTRFSEVVDRVERQQDRVVVTRNGKPAAVLISPDDLDSLEETLAVMTDRSIATQVRDSEKATAAGEPGTELGQLRGKFEKRRARQVNAEKWRRVVMPPARREFDRLPIAVAAAVLETLEAIEANPPRLGKPMMFAHEGRFSARFWVLPTRHLGVDGLVLGGCAGERFMSACSRCRGRPRRRMAMD